MVVMLDDSIWLLADPEDWEPVTIKDGIGASDDDN